MARSEARVSVDIWMDPDFLALPATAQRLYFFLLSQPDMAHDGVVPLRERRWASSAAGQTVEDVRADLVRLAGSRFVVVDPGTEELLVRSLIRRDGIYRQPNLLRAARKHLSLVTSTTIRAALETELQRIRDLEDISKACVELIDVMLDELHAEASPNPSNNPSPNPSSMPLGERGGVTAVTTGEPLTPFPLTLPPPAGNSLALAAPATVGDLIAEWIEHCRKRPPANVIAQIGKQVRALLAEGVDPVDVRAGLAAWHHKGVHPSVLPSMVNEVMNASPTARARPSTTNSRVDVALALADELERQEIGS